MGIAYRTMDVPAGPTRTDAVETAGRWARRYGVAPRSFQRTIERVEPLDDGTGAGREARDSFAGLAVVDARTAGAGAGTAHEDAADTSAGAADSSASASAGARFRVYFRLGTGSGSVDIVGFNPRTTVDGDATALTRRLTLACGVLALGFGGAAWAWSAYVGRHRWFEQHGVPWTVLACGVCAAVSLAALVAEWTLGRAARRGAVLLAAALLIAGAATAGVLRVRAHEPSAAHAAALARGGEHAQAYLEAEALDAIGPRGAPSAVDDLGLAEIPAGASLEQLIAQLHRGWRRPQARARVLERVRAAATARVNASIATHEMGSTLREVADLVAEWLPAERLRWMAQAELMDTERGCAHTDGYQGFLRVYDPLCFLRGAETARAQGVDAGDIQAARQRFLAGARTEAQRFAAQLPQLASPTPGECYTSEYRGSTMGCEAMIRELEFMTESFQRHFGESLGVDVAPLRARLVPPAASAAPQPPED